MIRVFPGESSRAPSAHTERFRTDLVQVLRRYGYWAVDEAREGLLLAPKAFAVEPRSVSSAEFRQAAFRLYFLDPDDLGLLPDLDCRAEPAGGFAYEPRTSWWGKTCRQPCYRPLLPHVSVAGAGVVPIWVNEAGRSVLAWYEANGRRDLIVGLSFAEELIRYAQGEPRQVEVCHQRALWGFGHERPVYLYATQLDPERPYVPWADHLGYAVAELLARATRLPLAHPLPGGARGAILLTGDDDEAFLERYDQQLRLIAGFPITYLLLPSTLHTPETLRKLPPNVELGIHVDALQHPERYDEICQAQTATIRAMIGRPVQPVRNHGHLSREYWGHLKAWDECGLHLDLNVPGMDGTARTGSFLPFHVRRADGTWSPHLSLLSGFADGMHFQLKLSEAAQSRLILNQARQIHATRPGVMVFNFHPQNVGLVTSVHRTVLALGRQRRWVALGSESYLAWLQGLDTIRMRAEKGRLLLESPGPIERLAFRFPTWWGWSTRKLRRWSRKHVLDSISSQETS